MNIRSIISGILTRSNPLENPSISLASPAVWSWLIGGEPTAAGEQVTELTALHTSTVYACVRVLSESVASLPLLLYERADGGRKEAYDASLHDLLCYQPNPEMSAFTFFETMTGSLALTGNCYAQIERNAGGQPVALWPLHPLKTEAKRTTTAITVDGTTILPGSLLYETSSGMPAGKKRIVNAADVLAVPLFCFDGLKGLSPIQQARQGIGLAQAAEKFGARFFGGGSRPGGLLINKTPGDEKQISANRESWESQYGGANQGRTAILRGDWTYQQLSLSPEDSQFLATRKFQREDICGLFRVPPHMVGDMATLSGSNHEQQSLQFVTDTLRPYLCRFEQEIQRKLMPSIGRNSGKYFVQFDVRERLRGDFKSQMDGYALGRQWGIMTANQCLEDMGEDPVGEVGDILLYPTNMGNAQALLHPAALLPVSGDPTKAKTDEPAKDETPKEDKPAPEPNAARYLTFFGDSVGRLLNRSKRDYEAISGVFSPTLRALLTDAEHDAALTFDLPTDWNTDGDKILRDVCKQIEKRADAWTVEKRDEVTATELQKAAKAIRLSVFRAAAELIATK